MRNMPESSETGRHWFGLKITDEFTKMGTGKILVCEYGNEPWIERCPFEKGDTVEYTDENLEPVIYKITGIESGRNLFDGKIRNIFGLIVIKI